MSFGEDHDVLYFSVWSHHTGLVVLLTYFADLFTSDGAHHDLFPQTVSCKCYFYNNLGQLSPNQGSYEDRINDVLRRRFLRQGSLQHFIIYIVSLHCENEDNRLHVVTDCVCTL